MPNRSKKIIAASENGTESAAQFNSSLDNQSVYAE